MTSIARRAALIHVTTAALALCLVLVSLLFTGFTEGERMAMKALAQLDAPYIFGTRGPDTFDCSGLVLFCAESQGVEGLPHAACELYTLGRDVPMWDLLPGDWVCFDTVRDSDPSDHIGIWIGGNCFVHASSNKHCVTVSALEGYYLEKFSGARRVSCAYL